MKVRLSARTVLVIGIAILVGCGTSGGSTSDAVGPPPGGSYDVPPGGFDPAPGQDTPPGDYDPPPGSTVSPPGGGTGTCNSFCQGVIGRGCTELGNDVSTCVQQCNAGIGQVECANELLALLDCALKSPDFTCDLLGGGEAQQGQFTECTQQALAYATCADGGGEGGRGGI